jgi:hypothetical protein
MKLLTLLSCLMLTGCAELRSPSYPEIAYQIANGYDFAQTVNTARGAKCGYYEKDPVTSQIIGTHPTVPAVEGMWAAQALGHYLISNWLDREIDATDSDAWRGVRIIWFALTLGNAVHNDVANARIGLTPFGSGCP